MLSKRMLLSNAWRTKCGKLVKRNYGTAVVKDILKLHERGIFQSVIPEDNVPDLALKLSSPQSIYCGFDPTADSLHVGNLLAIIGLIHCQRAGHEPIALVGGATGQIGDPSGKTQDRDIIAAETLEDNIIGIQENLERVFTNHAMYLWHDQKDLKDVRILNNMDWYNKMNVIDFLTNSGRHFRMNSMLNKHSVKSRLSTKAGMSFTEFTYQTFQAYDWLYLMKNHNCYIQLGGHDQYGNITSGMDFIHKAARVKTFGLTLPLITSSQGHKVGKSEGNAIWLDPTKTTPYELYQYFLNIPDTDVSRFLNLFTFLPTQDLENIVLKHKFEPHKRRAQTLLAEKVLLLVHGEEGLSQAQRLTEVFFSKSTKALLQLTESDIQSAVSAAPSINLMYQHDMTVLDLVMKCKLFDREVDAIKMIQEGGIYINHVPVTEEGSVLIQGQHILTNQITLLRIGKKRNYLIKWLSFS